MSAARLEAERALCRATVARLGRDRILACLDRTRLVFGCSCPSCGPYGYDLTAVWQFMEGLTEDQVALCLAATLTGHDGPLEPWAEPRRYEYPIG